MSEPFFSILITAYNRPDETVRCVRSCSEQDFRDLEIVVVDDASTDATPSALAAIDDPRLRVIRHAHNRGISPARATAVTHAAGQWFVILDSDWELVSGSLARLREVIDGLPDGIRVVRSRLRCDDGSLQPGVLPDGITDYDGRLRWCEAVVAAAVSSDAGHCVHRDVFEAGNFIADRRGEVEALWELNLARRERSLWIPDVLGIQHTGSLNSHSRDLSPHRLIPRLLAEAPDQQWMVETLLAEHGLALARIAPRYRLNLLERGVLESSLAGDRRAAVRHAAAATRAGSRHPVKLWATLAIGMVEPRALAWTKVMGRRWRARIQPGSGLRGGFSRADRR